MNRILSILAVALASSCAALAQTTPRTLTVTTTNNVTPPAGSLSLLQALRDVQAGDTIAFNIPGDGPHVIITPLGGYPLITADNVTIDGYSQPGASPNSNPILGGNNAKIKIVLDSTGDDSSGDAAKPDRRSTRLPYPGYGDSENGILGVYEADGVTIKGLSFQARHTAGTDEDPKIYCVALVKEAKNTKVQGCWLGLAPDGTTVKGNGSAVAAFRHRVNVGGVNQDTFSGGLVFGTDGNGTNDVAEFNISVGMHIALALEAPDVRVSGNYFNVMPDGKTFYDVEALHQFLQTELGLSGGDATVETFENGRVTDNTIIGTNGDGRSDANERNIFAHSVYEHDIEFYSSAVNVVIAGNYFGVGVDGATTQAPLTAAAPDFAEFPGTGSVRVGSNGDGISDALEGNVIYNMPGSRFIPAGANVPLVARRNRMVNNSFGGFPFADGENGRNYATYYANALQDPAAAVPALASVQDGILSGSVPAPNTANYPFHVIDVYVVDVASANNNLTLPGTFAASFVEGSSRDRDPAPNAFKFDLNGLPVPPGSRVAIAVTYSKSATNTLAPEALTGPLSASVEAVIPVFSPAGIESVGLTRITPDTTIITPEADALGNWEPYISVLGTSAFLIEGNTFAEGTTDKQRYVVAIQPADGKPMKMVEGFYADNGTPFKGPINASRQNGNPGRIGADKRPGAVNYMVGGEASPHTLPEFGTGNRWSLGFDRGDSGRYSTVQAFALDTTTLTPTPLFDAIDAANGRVPSGASATNPEISRFGGDIVCLDNGNFVVVSDDRSNAHAGDRTATVVILAPDGSIVKDTFPVAPSGQIWANVAAIKGGFVIRLNATLFFYDNAGTLLGQTTQDTSGESFDTGRGDGTRIAGHINSPYVYLAGKVRTAPIVKVAAWDSRDRSFVAVAEVSEPAFAGDFDRVNVAVDALDRLVVSWVSKPAEYELEQVAARVLALNASAKTITPLTKSFFPFVNNAKAGGIRTVQMSVALTTRQICVAAKGEINLQGKPTLGANSPREVNFFTVFTHPDPQNDPTTPAGGAQDITLSIALSGNNAILSWTGPAGTYTVQRKNSLSETTWTSVTTTTEKSFSVPISSGAAGFFRVSR